MYETTPDGTPAENQGMPYMAMIRAGTSSEKALVAQIPENLYRGTIGEILDYALNNEDLSREQGRLVTRIKEEMKEPHDIHLFGSIVDTRTPIEFRPATETIDGQELQYQGTEIVIVAEGDGGLEYNL